MGRPLYTNNAATYLAFGITNTATTMQVSANAGSLFPNPTGGDYFYVSLISLSGPIIEIVKCTARSGDIFTIERGQEGTTPLYWNMGDNVQLRITAAGMNYIAGSTASTTLEQSFTATQGQTVFTLTNFDYAPGTNNLAVFVNGSKQVSGTNYTETNVNTVTFTTGLNVGDVVEFLSNLSVAAGTIYATDINYNEGATGAVTRTLESKLQESVSVKDFGAIGDGTTDDTAAIQNALSSGNNIYFPQGTYIISSALVPSSNQTIFGAGINFTIIKQTSASANAFTLNNLLWVTIKDLKIICSAATPTNDGIYYTLGQNHFVTSVQVDSFKNGLHFTSANGILLSNVDATNNTQNGFRLDSSGTPTIGVNFLSCNAYGNIDGILVVGNVAGCTLDTLNLTVNTNNGIEFVSDGTGMPTNFFCTKLICDSNGSSGYLITNLNQSYFNNCWSSNRGTGHNFYSAGTQIQIIGGFFEGCNGHGIELMGPYNSVIGATISNAGVNTANTYDAIYCTSTFPVVSGCSMYSGNSGATDKTRYAINLTSSVTNATITGNNVIGVFGTPKINVGTTDQITLQNISNNAGFENTAVIANEFGSTYGTQTVLNTATTTLTTLDSVGINGNYLLFVGQYGSTTGGIYALAYVRRGSASSQIFTIHATTGIALSISGQNIQLTNTYGGDILCDWSLVKYVADGAINV